MFGFWSALRLLTLPSPLLAAGTRGLVQMLVGDMQQLHLTLGTGWLGLCLFPMVLPPRPPSQVASAAFWQPLSSHGGEQRGAEAVEVGCLWGTYPELRLLFYSMAQLAGKVSAQTDGKALFKLLLCSQRLGLKPCS